MKSATGTALRLMTRKRTENRLNMENKKITDETIKSLTEEEFLLLKYFNEGESYKNIKEKYGITLYTNDPRVLSLYDKFDVYDRIDLIKKYRLYLEEKSGKMTIENMINSEVYGTESGKKLYKMLSDVFKHSENIENVILLLETEENRQKMIKFLETGNRTVDEIHYYTAKLESRQ